MLEQIKDNALFRGMSTEMIEECINDSHAIVRSYQKNDIVFSQVQPPSAMYVLLSGSVVVCKDSQEGKRYIITHIKENDIFGEVFLFLENVEYKAYVVTTSKSQVLEIPKEYFYSVESGVKQSHSMILRNLLNILAGKAYFLSGQLELLTSGSLRQRIAKHLVENCLDNKKYIKLGMNREQFSDYLNVARPSLSRELIRMKEDGLIDVDRDMIKILNYDGLIKCLSKEF